MRRIALAAILLAAFAAIVVLRADGESKAPKRAQLSIVRVASGLTEPVVVTAPRNEPNNIYVAEKVGRVRVIVKGRLRARPFLDIRSLVLDNGEQGFLGLAFSPNYAKNRHFYVDYTDRNGNARIVEYKSRGLSRKPRKLRQIFFQKDPYENHNGGNLVFGPGGYLYTGTGDGGSGGDPENRAQNLKSTFGKLLRFNVGKKHPSPIIVGYGLRNPWRFSFDRQTGDLYIGDVGQDSWEELDYTKKGTAGLENYGWRVFEGKSRFTPGQQPNAAGHLVTPYIVLPNGPYCSVIGGFVYRGNAVPAAQGRYFFGDNCVNKIHSTVPAGASDSYRTEPFTVDGLSAFGEDAKGELYLASVTSGNVYRLAG
jgi:glucose/arabinose dehydrogenase